MRLPAAALCPLLLLFLPPAWSAENGPSGARRLIATDGPAEPAALRAIGADEMLTFQTEKGERRVALRQLVSWGSSVEPTRGPVVVTATGSRFLAADPNVLGGSIEIGGNRLRIESELFGVVELPLEGVRAIVFRLPSEPLKIDRLLAPERSAAGATDRFLLANGDELTGNLTQLKDDQLTLRSGTDDVTIPVARLRAVVMGATLVARDPAETRHLQVGFAEGSLLAAKSIETRDGKFAIAPADPGVTLAPLAAAPVFLQPLSSSVTYLSDLTASSYKHAPFLSTSWPYGIDRNVVGGRLRSGGQLYLKGLALHSAARLSYALAKPHERFEAELALDDLAGTRGSVVYRVYLLRGEEWRPVYASPIIRGGAPPLPMSVALEGAKAITLMVDFADRGDELDHANWLNARLIDK